LAAQKSMLKTDLLLNIFFGNHDKKNKKSGFLKSSKGQHLFE